jgi:hypothetical protein
MSEVRPITGHRRDLGDVDGLAASVAKVGLLHPVGEAFQRTRSRISSSGMWRMAAQGERALDTPRARREQELTAEPPPEGSA